MPVIIPDCTSCKNFIDYNDASGYRCNAFPEGIPEEYFWGKIDVKEIQTCANGFNFVEEEMLCG